MSHNKNLCRLLKILFSSTFFVSFICCLLAMFIFSHDLLLLVDCNRGRYRSNSKPWSFVQACVSSAGSTTPLEFGFGNVNSQCFIRLVYEYSVNFFSFNHILRPIHRCMDERTLQTFISYCFYILHIRTSSIRGYLSALRYHCLTVGLQDPSRHSDGRFKFSLRTLLHVTEKGQRGPRSCRSPINIDILSRLCSLLNEGFFKILPGTVYSKRHSVSHSPVSYAVVNLRPIA